MIGVNRIERLLDLCVAYIGKGKQLWPGSVVPRHLRLPYQPSLSGKKTGWGLGQATKVCATCNGCADACVLRRLALAWALGVEGTAIVNVNICVLAILF